MDRRDGPIPRAARSPRAATADAVELKMSPGPA